jgi:hypothetical protein
MLRKASLRIARLIQGYVDPHTWWGNILVQCSIPLMDYGEGRR